MGDVFKFNDLVVGTNVEKVTGAELVVGQCYKYKGKNMGKFIKFEVVGRIPYDADERYTFEEGKVDDGLFHQRKKEFTPVECITGGARRKRVTRRRVSTRKSRKTRVKRNRSSRRYKKHKR